MTSFTKAPTTGSPSTRAGDPLSVEAQAHLTEALVRLGTAVGNLDSRLAKLERRVFIAIAVAAALGAGSAAALRTADIRLPALQLSPAPTTAPANSP